MLYPQSVIAIHLTLFFPLSSVCVCFIFPVTGPLSESQIAYMSRETLQVVYTVYLLSVCFHIEGGEHMTMHILGEHHSCILLQRKPC